ncbi:MAG: PQQ-like beta-propeller repeat protein [Candidatus Poribacteria bacterium]|nr:PQQ-like beta-propeller repeat protein [Candidatus Poribacteria bacterium]MDE0506450.1 PQQ-like beta-propeller repeat protein [Candidatus Poribacteria bacterium]
MSSSNAYSKGARWWLLITIIAIAVLASIWIWTSEAGQRQEKVFQAVFVAIISLFLSLCWLLIFSRLKWRIRFISFGGILLAILLCIALFRIRGFTGDLVPILEWRWSSTSGEPTVTDHEAVSGILAIDYPQFLGPNRNATLHGINLARDWSIRPPRLIWRQPIGEGWSAFAVVGNSAITQAQEGENENVVCYDLTTGELQWSHSDFARFEVAPAGIGPRATPTIAGDRVYTLGATGLLNCLDFVTGKPIWSTDIINNNKSRVTDWGMSGSPLVTKNAVIVSAGGTDGSSLVAYHKDTGEIVWRGGDDPSGYSSPQLRTLAGIPQILIFNYKSVVSHDPNTGHPLWRYAWPSAESVAQPVPLPGDQLLVSSGYGIGSKLFQIQRSIGGKLQAHVLWESRGLKAKFTNVVYRHGYVYGLDDGILVCIDISNGKRTWKRGRYGHGQIILVDDLLLVQAESGDVVMLEVNPTSHVELGSFPALAGRTWNNSTLAAPYL